MKATTNVKKVVITDYSDYKPGKPGAYWFSDRYTRLPDGNWEASHGTSCSGYDYCQRCGSFHAECDEEFEVVSLEFVIGKISRVINDPDIDIRVEI